MEQGVQKAHLMQCSTTPRCNTVNSLCQSCEGARDQELPYHKLLGAISQGHVKVSASLYNSVVGPHEQPNTGYWGPQSRLGPRSPRSFHTTEYFGPCVWARFRCMTISSWGILDIITRREQSCPPQKNHIVWGKICLARIVGYSEQKKREGHCFTRAGRAAPRDCLILQ